MQFKLYDRGWHSWWTRVLQSLTQTPVSLRTLEVQEVLEGVNEEVIEGVNEGVYRGPSRSPSSLRAAARFPKRPSTAPHEVSSAARSTLRSGANASARANSCKACYTLLPVLSRLRANHSAVPSSAELSTARARSRPRPLSPCLVAKTAPDCAPDCAVIRSPARAHMADGREALAKPLSPGWPTP
eukprot:4643856-Pyramimonas_sp.AAC.1